MPASSTRTRTASGSASCPIWEVKEPSIVAFLKVRVALPLFFERALIEVTPRRVLYWSDGDAATAPQETLVATGEAA